MRALAERLGMRAPSLYKHVADKEELEALLIAEALREMGAALRVALERAGSARPRVGRARPSRRPTERGRSRIRTSTGWRPRASCRATAARGPRGVDRRSRSFGSPERDRARAHLGVRARDDDPRARRPVPSGRRPRRGLGFRPYRTRLTRGLRAGPSPCNAHRHVSWTGVARASPRGRSRHGRAPERRTDPRDVRRDGARRRAVVGRPHRRRHRLAHGRQQSRRRRAPGKGRGSRADGRLPGTRTR